MTGTVLVVYGTTNGSTAQIAEAVADVMAKEGLAAEALPAGSVEDVPRYDAVVAGGRADRGEGKTRRQAR